MPGLWRLQVWLMLKPELMAPGAIEGLPPDELATKRAAAAAAAGALRACCGGLGPGELDALVLRGVCVDDLLQYLGISSSGSGGGSGPWWTGPAATQELPGRARGRLACIAAILGEVSGPELCLSCCRGCGWHEEHEMGFCLVPSMPILDV
jgi:hypothetical protein